MRVGYLGIVSILCLCLLTGCTLPAGLPFPSQTTQPDDTSTVPPVSDSETTEPVTADTIPPESTPDSDTGSVSDSVSDSENDSDTTEPAETTEEDLPVILPSLVGQDVSVMDTLLLHRVEIGYVYVPNTTPAGTIFDISFSGTQTETEILIDPDTKLTLYVSTGTELTNVTVVETDRTIYLTFDDGPSPKNTPAILDTLDDYGIKATFFLVGTSVASQPDLVREIYDRGHKIGCHSYTHEYADIYASVDNMMAELAAWEKAVEAALGFVPEERLFRFPGGSSLCKDQTIRQALAEAGMRMFDWNIVNNDCFLSTRPADMTAEEYIQKNVTSTFQYSLGLKNSPHILLMHDTYAETAEFLPWIIDYLTEQGCTFDTLDALPGSWLH